MANKQDKPMRAGDPQASADQEESKRQGQDRPSQELRTALSGGKLPRPLETSPAGTDVNEEAVWRAAVNHCLFHYPTLYTPGVPELSSSGGAAIWVVPIVLRFPLSGTVGTVGSIRIDARSGQVIDSTPAREAIAKGRQLYEGSSDAGSSAPIPPRERG